MTGFSLARGAEATFFNPANLQLTNNELHFLLSYGRVFLDIEHSSLFLAKKIMMFNLGLGLVNFDYGDMVFKPDYPTEDDNATFNANDLSFFFAAATKLSPKGNIGLSFKFIKEYIYIYSAQASAINLALNYLPTPNNTFSFGVFDIGTSLQLKDSAYSLPVRFSLGASNYTKKFLTGFDFHYLIHSKDWILNMGEELTISHMFKFRGGFRYFDGLTFNTGFGITFSWLALDYGLAYLPKRLGFSHYLSLKRNF